MANISFRERHLFLLFPSTFVSLLTAILLLRQLSVINGELFTALSQWETLIRVENNFVELLNEFVEERSGNASRMEDLKKFLNDVKPKVAEATRYPEGFLSHPVNGFLMIKRFTSDWLEVEGIVNNQSESDLEGAIKGLFRLQDVYKLSAQDFADGHLSKQFPNVTMKTEDCFQVAINAYHDDDFGRAKEWMTEALKKFDPQIYSGYLTRKIIQEYLAWCEYEIGNTSRALEITREILNKDPNSIKARDNAIFFENVLKNKEEKADTKSRDVTSEYMETYARLCRGATKKTAKDLAKLTCYYDHSKPQLAIKPGKVEEMNLEPRIVKYKNVITDEEIKIVKKLANPRLRRATINNLATGQLEFAQYRISKSAWLSDDEDEVVQRLSARIRSLTGLETSLSSAEEMQVANYGIGGHYEPHWDHATNDKASILKIDKGNRIATFLIYMSDVESGGYTVFLQAEAVVRPTKGDAVFWYNLRRSGAGDSTTRHAACPVIVGSKWVSNKWIHAHGQEFKRKCALEFDGLAGEQVLY